MADSRHVDTAPVRTRAWFARRWSWCSRSLLYPGENTIAPAERTVANQHRGSTPRPTSPRDAPDAPLYRRCRTPTVR